MNYSAKRPSQPRSLIDEVRGRLTRGAPDRCDVLVVGAGFGGLGAALSLAERGYRVHLIESLRYPGGCAGTFMRRGFRFEAGATLSSGFGSGQLFNRWIERYALPLSLSPLETIIKFRSELIDLDVGQSREQLVSALCEGRSDHDRVRAFFRRQERISRPLWSLFEDPSLLPPFTVKSLLRHAARIPAYAPLLRAISKPMGRLIDEHQLRDHKPLMLYLNALCQITSQCTVDEVEAPFGLATMDYYYKGVMHVEGGLGSLAWGLCYALLEAGGSISLSTRARSISRAPGGGWAVETRDGTLSAPKLVTNLIPSALESLIGSEERAALPKWVQDRQVSLEDGWGAAMLYLVTESPDEHIHGPAEHWQMVGDAEAPLMEGNHVFCSISSSAETEKAPAGSRAMTLSTHIPMKRYCALSEEERGEYVHQVQQEMRHTFERRCPQWAGRIYLAMSASPRTFERFTGRPMGYVGGAPRRAGLRQYLQMSPREALKGLYLVGDSVFPGQSTLATATGGHRLAALIDNKP